MNSRVLNSTINEQTMLTVESGSMASLTPAQQMQLRHANRRWIICLAS